MGLLDAPAYSRAQSDARFGAARKPTVVLFGDSRTADCDYNADPFIYSTNMSWFDWGQGLRPGGPVFDVLNNAGIGGNTTTQMAARMATDVLAYAPSHMTIWAGTNDGWTSLADVDASVARMTAMVDAARAAGIYTFLISETTSNAKGTDFPKLVGYYNDRLRWYAARSSAVEFWDFNAVITDPTNANGYNKSALLRDGVHPSPLGASTLGKLVVAPKLARISTELAQLAVSPADSQSITTYSRNVAINPLMGGTTGTVGTGHTGTLPTAWTSSGNTATFSTVPRGDGIGNDLKIALAATSTSSVFLSQTLDPTKFVAAKRYVIEAALGIDALAGVSAVSLTCSMFVSATEYRRGFGYPVQATASGDTLTTGDRIIRSRVFTAPAGMTSASALLRIGPSDAAATGTIRLGRFSIKQLD